jgi:acyl-coenzyme A synthetase/AMP-(fatty) acid ligase
MTAALATPPSPIAAEAPSRRPRPAWRRNLSELLLDDALGRFAERPAIHTPAGAVTYGDVSRLVGSVAGGLRASGVDPGDTLALAQPDGVSWITAFLGVVRIGAIVAPVSVGLPVDRRDDAVRRARAVRVLEGVFDGFPDPGPADTRADDPCYMLLTSGSTGRPKWAIHRHGDIPACIATYGRRVIRLRSDDVTYSVASLATSYGLGNSLYFPFGAGASAWIDGEPPTPEGLAHACRHAGVTAIFGVPTFWARLARHVDEGRVDRRDLASVRLGVSAGEPLPDAVWRHVRASVGIALVDGLGSSEATNLYLSSPKSHPRPGRVGWVVPGYHVRLCDAAGHDVPPGEVGEVLVSGPTLMSGYLGDEIATDRALAGGWLHTGDLARCTRGEGYTFVGRAGDRFKAGAMWVDPSAVAAALMHDHEVAEAAVVGVPDVEGILRVVAVVALVQGDHPEGAPDRILRRSRDRLAAHEVPRTLVVVPALPTTPTGKVRRDDVESLARQALTGGMT